MQDSARARRFIVAGHANLFRKICCNNDLYKYFHHVMNNLTWQNESITGMHKYEVGARRRNPNSGQNYNRRSNNKLDRVQVGTCRQHIQHKNVNSQRTHKTHRDFSTPEGVLFGIHEPGMSKGKIPGFPNCQVIYDPTVERPRAAIVASKELDFWPVPDFTNIDMATGLLKTGNKDCMYIYVVSLYLDSQTPIVRGNIVPALMHKLLKKCRETRTEILILSDTNSHASSWNSPTTNERGDCMDNFIVQNRLQVHNVGTDYTFLREDTESIIDVTLSSNGITPFITNWQVRDATPCSDHASIEFLLHFEGAAKVWRTDFKHAQWDVFKPSLESRVEKIETPLEWTPKLLEEVWKSFLEAINESLEESTKKKQVRLWSKNLDWWSAEIGALRRKLQIIKSYLQTCRKQHVQRGHIPKYTHDDLVVVRRDYTRIMRRAKRQAWKDFVENTENMPQAARLHKILKGKNAVELGLLKMGDELATPEESVDILCNTHFPDCQNNPPYRRRPKPKCKVNDAKASFINVERVFASIKSFGALKGAGPDALPPIVYQNIGSKALVLLTDVYRASYLLSYLPPSWLEVRAIFIPKPDKEDYGVPKAFRPISLMNFSMKILEKLLVWNNEATVMQNHPLHPKQHGFRVGRSCESALTQVVEIIETAFVKKKYTVGLSMDIEGAYDNITNHGMEEAMRKRGCEPLFIAWYSDFLRNRSIQVEYKGVEVKKYPTKGAPQGGVGSPFLWCLILDSLLPKFDDMLTVHSVAYADDVIILCQGASLPPIAKKLQSAIKKCEEWGAKNQLRFSPHKTKAIVFSNKRCMNPPKIKMGGLELQWSEQIKYLGVWLDRRLNYSYHMAEKIKSVRHTVARLSAGMGKLWGTSPLLALWMWKGIARPKLLYGALVWSKVTRREGIKLKLKQLQRLAFKMLGFFRYSTPTAGMEQVTYTYPMELAIDYSAIMAYIRTRAFSPYDKDYMYTEVEGLKGHRQIIRERADDIDLDIDSKELDLTPRKFNWERNYEVQKMSMYLHPQGTVVYEHDYHFYTDGSKEDEYAGAAAVGYAVQNRQEECLYEESFHLGGATVGQSEMFAIGKAAKYVADNPQQFYKKTICIYTDSQSCLHGLAKITTSSHNTNKTVEFLNKASKAIESKIDIRWVKGHSKVKGNDRADHLAKAGRDNQGLMALDIPKPPSSALKAELRSKMNSKWARVWNTQEPCRQTKDFFPFPRPEFSFHLMKCNRVMFSKVMHIVTGHAFLGYHNYLVAKDSEEGVTPMCTLCKKEDSRQTSWHILANCEALMELRMNSFGHPFLNSLYDIKKVELVLFLSELPINLFPFEMS